MPSLWGRPWTASLAQTYRDYEIIVVDDGSTDDTQAVLAGYHELIIPIYQENKGLSAARNTGIRASSGKYIAFLDADDLWLPEKLERQVPLFEQDASVGLVCSDMSYFDQDGDRPGTAFGMKDRPIRRGMVYPLIFLNSFIFMPTVVVRKSCFDERGLFDETLKACEDLEMWLRITREYAVDFADAPLAKYRFSTNQLHQNTTRVLHYRILVQEKFFGNSQNCGNWIPASSIATIMITTCNWHDYTPAPGGCLTRGSRWSAIYINAGSRARLYGRLYSYSGDQDPDRWQRRALLSQPIRGLIR